MQVQLTIPSLEVEWLSAWLLTLQTYWQWLISEPWTMLLEKWVEFRQHAATSNDGTGGTSEVLWPLLGLLIIFWPVLFSIVMFFVTAGTWILWLATSMLLGALQVGYAMYHFGMIAVDIFGLSVLKTYTVVRNYVLNFMETAASSTTTTASDLETSAMSSVNNNATASKQQQPRASWFALPSQKKSRRRFWKQSLEQAGTYENFLKIRITPKQTTSKSSTAATAATTVVDSALPPHNNKNKQMPRVQSFNEPRNAVTAGTSHPANHSSSSSLRQRRRHSISSLMEESNEVPVEASVVEDLGEKTAQLLVTTTKRLEQARTKDSLNDENELKYLLCSVVKRNHLGLDDVLIDNARSIALTGEYGLSAPTRHCIRAYYEQVEKGLHWLAEAPVSSSTTTPRNANTPLQTNLSLLAEQEDEMDHTPQPSPIRRSPSSGGSGSFLRHPDDDDLDEPTPPARILADRVRVVRKMKQNMGRTALMLSGGGAQAMYHAGLIRALIESNVYKDIQVVSGTSGGSITAAVRISFDSIGENVMSVLAHLFTSSLTLKTVSRSLYRLPFSDLFVVLQMCAIKTPEELLDHVCVSNVSTDYLSNGEMKRQNIRWFPKPLDMATYWIKHKLLVDSAEFRRTCQFYYGSITFEEAFARTGKHVCITVSASRAHGRSAQRLLLNHISTPHVTIASAVGASCALPGVMAPTKLMCKNSIGELEPFEVDGVEWIDGSVQADLPFQRISTLFAVSSFIVSQTNFHIVPFLNKAHHPNQKSLYWRLFQTMEWDIRSRALKLSRLGLFPQFFGQDISKVFKQRYHGNLTIVPQFTYRQTVGLAVLANPTKKDMEGYLKYGQIAAWPHLNAIRDMIRLERVLDDCLGRLEERLRAIHGGDSEWLSHDDVDSIASSSLAFNASGSGRVRIIGRPSRDDSSSVYTKMNHLQEENQHLKQELVELKKRLKEKETDKQSVEGEQDTTTSTQSSNARSPVSDGGEGHLWNLVLGKIQKSGL